MQPAPDTQPRPSSFHLEKWYLDLVTDEGEAFIFYAARLKWGQVKIPCKWLLHIPVSGEPEQRYQFRDLQFPETENGKLTWTDNDFNLTGNWESRSESLQEQLMHTASGDLQWNCVQPLSRVNLNLEGKHYAGWGYAEQLLLSAEPWKLPLRVLQWGRYCADKQQLLWIEIQQDSTRQWVWYNGKRLGNATLTAGKLLIPESDLVLECFNSRPAVKENLLKKVLQKFFRFIPGFRQSVPGRFILSREKKWVSEGRLLQGGKLISKGWVVHEQVNFNQ